MQKKEERVILNLILARSNPVTMRQISIPDTYTIEELTAAVCTVFGIQPVEGELTVEGAAGDTVAELFSENDRGILAIPRESGKKSRIQLIFFIDKINKKAEDTGHNIPVMIKGTAYNLPADIWDVRDINYIMGELQEGKTAVELNNTVYYARELAVTPKKTDNAMRKLFAPETAKREVNASVKIPMRSLVGSHKLDTLKHIADSFGIYYYSGMRKAEIVERICNKYDHENIQELFDILSLDGYAYLKQYLLDESDERTDPLTESMLDVFYDRGLIAYVSGKGYCIASEVAELFEELYDTPKEKEYIRIKYLKAAMRACAFLYGVFNLKMFDAVLGVLNAEGISEKEKREYFLAQHKGKNVPALSRIDTDTLCYNSLAYKERPLKNKLDSIYPGEDFYLPDIEEIRQIDKDGIRFGKAAEQELAIMIKKYRYYSYYENESSIGAVKRLESMIHWGCSEETAIGYMENNMQKLLNWEGRSTIDTVRTRIKQILDDEIKKMPLVMLKGYSPDNCPKEMKQHYLREREKQKEQDRNDAASGGRRGFPVKKRYW